MKLSDLKENSIYLIIALLIVAFFTFSMFDGLAYWQSSGVSTNRDYHYVAGAHHVYGTGFYHK